MTEAQLQHAIIECAHTFQWTVAHFRPARVTRRGKETYETPVAADGKGWPDLTLVRDGRLIFAELKTETGRVSPSQRLWLDMLGAVSVAEDRVQVYEWRPAHWLDGTIEQVLR